ncbi:MAG: 6-phosphogluconolactonase [Propionibacteriaceae bacterium]|jgi:6-phosphogluconolactonase|nr:6-phosphogluconolactonase [Propionibacteriaceae bacterium]
MTHTQVVRHLDAAALAHNTASRLLDRVLALQANGGRATLCLTGGRTLLAVYAELGELLTNAPVDPARLDLWWGEEGFIGTPEPERIATRTLAALAGSFALDPAHTHPMPGSEGYLDAAAAADSYAKELGDTRFDVCLLGIGGLGQVASLFPGHPAARSSSKVAAVLDSPLPPSERLSLTASALSDATEVWCLARGEDKAEALRLALDGDPRSPAARVRGRDATTFLVDRAAASLLPYHRCDL